jgi:hypothetical protein
MKTRTSFFKKSRLAGLALAAVAALVMSTAAQALVGNSDPIFSSTLISRAFVSQSSSDGWILESAAASGVGGIQSSYATTFNVGDDQNNKQYRSILSFDTSPIPDNAVVLLAQLKIKIQGVAGTDPFATFGNLLVDMRNGHFGNSVGLEPVDFSYPASAGSVQEHISPITYSWYGVTLSAANLGFVSKVGVTQFRLRFNLASNNNNIADYDKFYSGDAPPGYQPQLIVIYYIPTANTQLYVNPTYDFAFVYPSQGQISNQTTSGAHITLPFAPGTNLVAKYLDIAVTPNATACSSPMTSQYLALSYQSQQVTINGINFLKQSGEQGAAGNIYNQVSYSTLKGTNCIIFYFTLHSVDAIYPPPPTFNMQAESAVFTNIVSSLTFLSP